VCRPKVRHRSVQIRYSLNEFVSDISATYFVLITLHLSITVFVISLTLRCCCFLHANGNPIFFTPSLCQLHSQTSRIHYYSSAIRHAVFFFPVLLDLNTSFGTSTLLSLLCTVLSYSLRQLPFRQIHWLHSLVSSLISCKIYP